MQRVAVTQNMWAKLQSVNSSINGSIAPVSDVELYGEAEFEQMAAVSLLEQQKIEQADSLSFDQYLEQYFADYLSVLETREWNWKKDGSFTYSSDALLKPATIKAVAVNAKLRDTLGFGGEKYDKLWELICQYGLGIPFNLVVAGTVNMDETTHGFSRKVIDRALTFDFGEFFPNDFDAFFGQILLER